MAYSLRYAYQSGYDLYAVIRNTSGQVYYIAGEAFETWAASSHTIDDYDVALTDLSGGLYAANMPSTLARGYYVITIHQRAGDTPASTDLVVGIMDTAFGEGLVDLTSGSLSSTGMTCAAMIDEVQLVTGTTSADEPIATEAQVTKWINRAQTEIARECPGLPTLVFKNTTSLDTTQSLRYSIDDITAGDTTTQAIAHLYKVWYADGCETEELIYLPGDEFDSRYGDPTHSDLSPDKPHYWTRRNRNIEIMPLSACAYCDKTLRIDGDLYPRDLTTDSVYYSDISLGVEDGLITYAVWKYYEAVGDEQRAVMWGKRWSNDDRDEANRGWLERFKDAHEAMPEWAGELFYSEY